MQRHALEPLFKISYTVVSGAHMRSCSTVKIYHPTD